MITCEITIMLSALFLLFIFVTHAIEVRDDLTAEDGEVHKNTTRTPKPITTPKPDEKPTPAPVPPVEEMKVFLSLVDPSVYDLHHMPPYKEKLPVMCAVYVSQITGINAANSEFKVQLLVRYTWIDERLAYQEKHPEVTQLQGEKFFRDRVWYPNVYVKNEKQSRHMEIMRENILISIAPDGRVSYMFRVSLTLACTMSLRKFPFDRQICILEMESWSIPDSKMTLNWTEYKPLAIDKDLEVVDYYLSENYTRSKTNEYVNESLWTAMSRSKSTNDSNFSALKAYFVFDRKSRHYVIEYYIPTIFLVFVSWVSFWLDPNAAPARVTLGTTTLLSFITLKRNMDSALPKVAYITAMGAWVFSCMAFIFLSLVEFAFVHTIHRRSASEKLQIKKPKAKYILRAGLSPMPSRRSSPTEMKKSESLSDLSALKRMETLPNNPQMTVPGENRRKSMSSLHVLSVNSLENYLSEAVKKASLERDNDSSDSNSSCVSIEIAVPGARKKSKKSRKSDLEMPTVEVMGIEEPQHYKKGKDANKQSKKFYRIKDWTKKKKQSLERNKSPVEWEPQKVSRYIDSKCKKVFPAAFLIFNIGYWLMVFVM